MYQCTNSSRKSTSGVKSVGVDVVVENPRPVFEVALKRSTELPKGLVHVVVEPGSEHGFTLPCTPIRESPRHLVLSLLT